MELRRPWLDYYTGSGLLAVRISSTAGDANAIEDDGDVSAATRLLLGMPQLKTSFDSLCS